VPGRTGARRDALARMRGGTRARPLLALVLRDVRLFLRDWPVLSDVVLASVLWPLAALLIPRDEAAPVALFARALVVMLAAGVGMEIATRSVPLERQATAWNALAGVPSGRWATGKALATAALGLPMLAVAMVVVGRLLGLAAADAAPLVAAGVAAFTLSAALGVWMGAVFGDPEWRHPRAMLRLGGRLLSTVLVVAQTLLWMVALPGLESLGGPGGPLVVAGPLALALLVGSLALAAGGKAFRQRWVRL
jgi:hypothetical protein